ncbi:DUF6884 domain-containing protein [Streptomyces cyaneofuscatus]|uniref:DUF6884 domain-containing protein n=1 Tax=Streptomyces cyaneofuscatus TaxID=66883 RepID=UPI00344D6E25
MNRAPSATRETPLSPSQRAGLQAAAVHGEGHVPPCLPDVELRQLAVLGLIETLGAGPEDRFGPLFRAARYGITEAGRSRARREPLPQLLLVPCSMGKAQVPAAPAAEMYVGAYHVAARKAASAVAADGSAQVLTLSAKYGLLRDDDRVLHYDLRAGQNGTVSARTLARQAHFLGVSAARVTVFAGRAYADLAATIWPALEHPLRGLGIGRQLAFFAALYRPARRSSRP